MQDPVHEELVFHVEELAFYTENIWTIDFLSKRLRLTVV